MTLHSPNLLQKITNLKLDIIDHTKKKLHIFELTVPLQFITDITRYNCTVNCIEMSSTGFISKRNEATLTKLHSFARMKVSLPQQSKISGRYHSYNIGLNQEDPEFATLIPYLILLVYKSQKCGLQVCGKFKPLLLGSFLGRLSFYSPMSFESKVRKLSEV